MTMPVEPPAHTVQGSASEPETVERPEPPTTFPEPVERPEPPTTFPEPVEGPANQTVFPEPVEGPATASALGPAWAPQQAPAAKVTERAHPLTPFVRGWIVILALAFGLGRELLQNQSEAAQLPPLEFLASGIGIALLGAVAVGYVSWRFTHFVIDADELRVDTGAVFKRSVRVAFDKVQAIDVVQPFAARLIGLAELQIDVGSQERVRLRYLKLTRAYALRDYLLARARGHQVAAQEHAQAASVLTDLNAQDEVLVKVPPQTLLLAAVTSHEFFSIVGGGIVTAAIVVYFGFGWGWLAVALPVASALFGFISRRVTGQFNYTLSRREHGLRISRGLTSLTSQSLPPRRIQAVQLTQSPIWRWLGLYRLDIAVIGWGSVTNDENDTGVSTILLPAGGIEQVRVALRAIWPRTDFEAIELRRPPTRARWLHPFAAPFMRWGHDGQLTVTRHGWLVRTWHLVPHARTQSVRISQGPLARRLRLAELEFHTAGGTIQARARGLDADSVRGLQTELLERVHHLPALDLSEPAAQPAPAADSSDSRSPMAQGGSDHSELVRTGQDAGPDAFRADQAEATISSTE